LEPMSVLTSRDVPAIRTIIDSIGAPISLTDLHADGHFRVFTWNRQAERFYGVAVEPLVGKSLRELNLRPEGRLELIEGRFRECIERREPLQFRDFAPVDTVRGRRWVHTTMTPLIDEAQNVTRIMSTIVDVTDLKRSEDELVDVLTSVLGGFISICAACKKVRDEDDTWHPVEGYFGKRSGARFSHSMCPDCTEQWYGSVP
jgi:PAS domain S-box-containing protein